MALVRRALTVSVFTEVDERGEGRSIKWLAAAMAGAPKFTTAPTVVVVCDEDGKEINRSSYGEISNELRAAVEEKFPI